MKPKTGQVFTCECCGAEFYRSKSYIANHKNIRFCSGSCHKAAIKSGSYKPGPNDGERPYRKLGEYITCQVCGKSHYRKASEINNGVNKTCSVKCRNKFLSGDRNYFAGKFVNIPPRPKQWTQKQRAEWLADKCVRCGSDDRLELDHIIPRGPHTRENTQTLCRSCNQRKCWHEDRIHYLNLPLGG